MKLTFLGTGAAFTVGSQNFHSNAILENDAKQKFLIDCGSDARHSLHEMGLSYKDITDVYISHLHADHIGGLEWLGFTRKFDPDCDRPRLYISEIIAEDLWNKSLSGSMESLEGELSKITTYFDLITVRENEPFQWSGVEFQLVQTVHIMNGYTLAPCHGLFFKSNGIQVYYSADTQFCPHLLTRFYEQADIIFHDCETSRHQSCVHANFAELDSLPAEIKKKMWLYHYQPGHLPDAKKHGFQGFVKKGQVFKF
jgi:ribonuclease BN (tRNA processing enzyme)